MVEIKMIDIISLLLIAYLIGSFSSAIFLSKKIFKTDIRNHGSKNAGSTNMFRVFGKKWGMLVFVIDVLKGFVCTSLFYILNHENIGLQEQFLLQIGLSFASVLGHVFPIYYHFKGGKGVATLLGVIIGLQPLIALYSFSLFIVVFLLTRYVSLSSITAGIIYPVWIYYCIGTQETWLYFIFGCIIALFLLLTHRNNIIRLLNGTENRFNFKKKEE